MNSIDSNIDIDSIVYLCPFGSKCRYGNSCSGIGGHSLDICKKEHISSSSSSSKLALSSPVSISASASLSKSICPLGDKCNKSIPAHKFIRGLFHCNRGPYNGYVVCFSRKIILNLKKELKYITRIDNILNKTSNNKLHSSSALLPISPSNDIQEIENCISKSFAKINMTNTTIDANQSTQPPDYSILIRQIKQAKKQAKKQINDWTLLYNNIDIFINTISIKDENFKKQMDESN
jgi:hypothetical protein